MILSLLFTILKACLAALLYLAGVFIVPEAGLGSLGNGAFSHARGVAANGEKNQAPRHEKKPRPPPLGLPTCRIRSLHAD